MQTPLKLSIKSGTIPLVTEFYDDKEHVLITKGIECIRKAGQNEG